MDKKDKILATILLISVISNAILIVKDIKKNNKGNTKVVAEVEDKYFDIDKFIVIERTSIQGINKYYILEHRPISSFLSGEEYYKEINDLFNAEYNVTYLENEQDSFSENYIFCSYYSLIDCLNIDELEKISNQGGVVSKEQLNDISKRINEEMSLQQEEGKSLKLD